MQHVFCWVLRSETNNIRPLHRRHHGTYIRSFWLHFFSSTLSLFHFHFHSFSLQYLNIFRHFLLLDCSVLYCNIVQFSEVQATVLPSTSPYSPVLHCSDQFQVPSLAGVGASFQFVVRDSPSARRDLVVATGKLRGDVLLHGLCTPFHPLCWWCLSFSLRFTTSMCRVNDVGVTALEEGEACPS